MQTIEIGQPIRFYKGSTAYAAQVTHVWSERCVNLVYFDASDGTWKQENSVETTGEKCWGRLSS